jgi:hypothetical protein
MAAPEPAPTTPGPADTLKATAAPTGHSSIRRPLFFATAGAAVAALAFGTVEAFNASAKRSDFNNHTATVNGVTYQDCGTANVSAACQPLKDAYDQAFTLSVVGFVAAGALAAGASAILLLTRSEHATGPDSSGTAHALGCSPDPVGRGLTCNLDLRF